MLIRLDECAMDVAVLSQTHMERYARFGRIADRNGNRRFGNGNDDIGTERIFPCETNAEIFPHLVDGLS